MKDFKILDINPIGGSVLIDWGFGVYNHNIPIEIIENMDITEKQILEILERERPTPPEPLVLPKSFLGLVNEEAAADNNIGEQPFRPEEEQAKLDME